LNLEPEGIRDGSKSDVDYEGVLQLVLDKGVDINARNFRGETPLMQVLISFAIEIEFNFRHVLEAMKLE
jgi:hypothetical protein